MKTLIALVIICVVSGFGLQNVKAQEPQKTSYHKVIGIKSGSFDKLDTNFSTGNNSGLYKLTIWDPNLTKIIIKPELVLTPIYSYHYDLINNPYFANNAWEIPEGEDIIITYYGLDKTFNAKWEMLTGKPLINTTLVYNSPMQRTSNTNLSDSFLYQLAGGIFRGMVSTKYHRLNESQNYPGANSPK